MANRESRDNGVRKKMDRVLIFHEYEYFIDALAASLKVDHKPCNNIDDLNNISFDLISNAIVCEERADVLESVLLNILNHTNPPRILLLTFCSRKFLKILFVKGHRFPELSECLKIGLITHLQLPCKPKEILECLQRMKENSQNEGFENLLDELQPHLFIRANQEIPDKQLSKISIA